MQSFRGHRLVCVICFHNISVAATGIEAIRLGDEGVREAAFPDNGPAQQDLGSVHLTMSLLLVPR